MNQHPARPHRLFLHAIGTLSLWFGMAALLLLLQSRSVPWLVGMQHEPHWSWAVGSGRLKIWVAELGVFLPGDTWTNSWYRGLDGQPIRWDFTLSRGSTGGVIVVAIPLWIFSCVGGLSGVLCHWLAGCTDGRFAYLCRVAIRGPAKSRLESQKPPTATPMR